MGNLPATPANEAAPPSAAPATGRPNEDLPHSGHVGARHRDPGEGGSLATALGELGHRDGEQPVGGGETQAVRDDEAAEPELFGVERDLVRHLPLDTGRVLGLKAADLPDAEQARFDQRGDDQGLGGLGLERTRLGLGGGAEGQHQEPFGQSLQTLGTLLSTGVMFSTLTSPERPLAAAADLFRDYMCQRAVYALQVF